MAEEVKTEDNNFTIEQLIKENKELKEINQMLSDLVDNYDKELRKMTELLAVNTNNLNKASKIIENYNQSEIRRIDEN